MFFVSAYKFAYLMSKNIFAHSTRAPRIAGASKTARAPRIAREPQTARAG